MLPEDDLIEEFGYWNEHPKHSLSAWQAEVANDATRLSYWGWCLVQDECEVTNPCPGTNEEESE